MDKPQDPEAAETVQTTSVPAVDLPRLVRLSSGDLIRRGDVFQTGDGSFLEMDRVGRILGVPCLGEKLKKSNGWFRPEPNTNALAAPTENDHGN